MRRRPEGKRDRADEQRHAECGESSRNFHEVNAKAKKQSGGRDDEPHKKSRRSQRKFHDERFKIRRQVRVHTAHGRFTGYVLLALPAALAIALSFINPEHMQSLFRERLGQLMLMGAIVMQTIGFIWIRQVIKIEV